MFCSDNVIEPYDYETFDGSDGLWVTWVISHVDHRSRGIRVSWIWHLCTLLFDWCADCAGDEVVELNGELLSGLCDEVLLEIVRGAELSGGEVELVIRLQWVRPSISAVLHR